MPKKVNFGEFLETRSLRSNGVTRQVNFSWTKIGGKCQNSKIQMRHILGNFPTMCNCINLVKSSKYVNCIFCAPYSNK